MAVEEVAASAVETPTETPAESSPSEAVESPKVPFETPGWVYAADDETAKPAPAARPEPPKPAPEVKAPQWEPPTFDPDLLARDGDRYMRWYQQQFVGPIAQAYLEQQKALEEIRSRASEPGIHPALVNQQMRRAQEGLSQALERFSSDPALANAGLKKRVEDYYRGLLREARTLAKKGDFSGIDALSDEDFHDTTFEYLKRKAGFKNGKPPASVASPDAALETPKGVAQAGAAKFTADEEEAYKYAHTTRGISRADFAKLLAADKAQREGE